MTETELVRWMACSIYTDGVLLQKGILCLPDVSASHDLSLNLAEILWILSCRQGITNKLVNMFHGLKATDELRVILFYIFNFTVIPIL